MSEAQHRAPLELLGGHVGRAADDGGGVRFLEQARGAEVGHLHDAALGDEDVGGAQVAMEDLVLVRVLDALQDLHRVGQGARDVEALLAVEHRLQALALDVLHDDEEDALDALGGDDADDVRMIEGGQEARLLQQVVEVAALAVGDLDGDLLVDPRVLREEDGAEAAGAQIGEDLVLTNGLSQEEHEGCAEYSIRGKEGPDLHGRGEESRARAWPAHRLPGRAGGARDARGRPPARPGPGAAGARRAPAPAVAARAHELGVPLAGIEVRDPADDPRREALRARLLRGAAPQGRRRRRSRASARPCRTTSRP